MALSVDENPYHRLVEIIKILFNFPQNQNVPEINICVIFIGKNLKSHEKKHCLYLE